ncbi:hypothetical protein Tco_1048593 [Tanacetum coccineum]
MRILSVVRIKAYSRYVYDYLSEIVLRRANFQEHTIAEKDFKNLYPSDFEDLNLLLLQGHLNHLSGLDKWMLSTAIQSMVDVPIHQEDLVVQRTLLIDPVISMVTKKTASTPTPPTTQAHLQMCSTSCWKDILKGV